MLAMQEDFYLEELEEDWEPSDYEEDPRFGDELGALIFSLHDVIARNPHTPADVLENLYFSGREGAVSSNPRLPDSLVRKIWASGDNDDKQNIIYLHDSLSDAFMIDVASKPDFWIWDDSVKSALATREDCPAFVLEMLIRQDPEEFYWKVRRAVLGNTNCPEKFLREYSADADDYHREIVAGNPSTPPEALTQLAEDVEKDVRQAVAKNHSAPTDILNQLANDPEWVVRYAVARNRSTPPEVLTQLAEDADEDVREAVADNPSTPSEVQARLESEYSSRATGGSRG
jgi:hypothetical protein